MKVDLEQWTQGCKPLLALSGGIDSMVLAHLLLTAGTPFCTCHVQHGIRGDASRKDAQMVRAFCKAHHIPLVTFHIDVPYKAHQAHMGLEQAARNARYACLARAMQLLHCDAIFTAHHKDDQAETILMHIVRGTSLCGLCGMSAWDESRRVARPLLDVTHQQILAYASAHHVPFVQDQSNFDQRYTRNYVRASVMPALCRINPRVQDALLRLAVQATRDEAYLARMAQDTMHQFLSGNVLGDIRAVEPAVSHRMILDYLHKLDVRDVQLDHIVTVLQLFDRPLGKKCSIGTLVLERTHTGVAPYVRPLQDMRKYQLPLQGKMDLPEMGTWTTWVGDVPQQLDLGRNIQIFDADKLLEPVWVGYRSPGLRIKLLGGGSKLLSDVLMDKKVPRAQRDTIPIVFCGKEPIWIVGMMPLSSACISEQSCRAYYIQFEKTKE